MLRASFSSRYGCADPWIPLSLRRGLPAGRQLRSLFLPHCGTPRPLLRAIPPLPRLPAVPATSSMAWSMAAIFQSGCTGFNPRICCEPLSARREDRHVRWLPGRDAVIVAISDGVICDHFFVDVGTTSRRKCLKAVSARYWLRSRKSWEQEVLDLWPRLSHRTCQR